MWNQIQMNFSNSLKYCHQNTIMFELFKPFEHFNLANISTPYELTFPKCGIEFKWIFLISIKHWRRNTNMFEHFKPVNIQIFYKMYQKCSQKNATWPCQNKNNILIFHKIYWKCSKKKLYVLTAKIQICSNIPNSPKFRHHTNKLSPKRGIKFKWIYLISIKYWRRNTTMFEHSKTLNI